MTTSKRPYRSCLLYVAALSIAASGCVHESNVNGELVFHYELWVPLSVLLGGLVASPIGWELRKYNARIGWSLLVAGPILAIVLAPSLFLDRVDINNDRFQIRTGIIGLTAVHSLQFADIKEIRITAEITSGRRGSKRTNYYLCCDKKSGESSKVAITNAVAKASAGSILQEAQAHGIPIRDETGGQ